ILSACHTPSPRHEPMPRADRAKQFMPYAALKGYDEEIGEKQEIFVPEKQLSEEQLARLDAQIFRLQSLLALKEKPRVEIEYFVPAPAWRCAEMRVGQYQTCVGYAEKLCLTERTLRLDGQVFCLDEVTRLRILREQEV
ncbi:MAG: hypothetical protein IJS53_02685, partial [Clostridia bacterium]|nr:hypothetical protein [Clostridia bacterium]